MYLDWTGYPTVARPMIFPRLNEIFLKVAKKSLYTFDFIVVYIKLILLWINSYFEVSKICRSKR